MSLRSRANFVAKKTGQSVPLIERLIADLGKDSAELAHTAGITLKEADLQLLQERYQVFCAICHKDHGFGENTAQGSGCASVILEHNGRVGILCCYGSKFDADYYDFVKTPPEPYLVRNGKGGLPDPVCDLCIATLVIEGYLLKRDGEFWWGPPWSL